MDRPIVGLIIVALLMFGLITLVRFLIFVWRTRMSQPESRLSRQIMSHIRARGGFCFKVHGGPLTMNGLPDITGVFRGYSIWIETKMPEGKSPSAIQLFRHREIEAAGGYVRVARSMLEVSAWLDTFRMPHSRRPNPTHTVTPTDGV